MNGKRIHAMITIRSSEWARKVVWTFIGFVRMGAESCFGLHGVRLVGVGGSLGLSANRAPQHARDNLFFS